MPVFVGIAMASTPSSKGTASTPSSKIITRSVSDIHETLCALEDGSSLTRYFRSKRPESRLFRVMLETRELVWMRNVGGKPEGVGMYFRRCHHSYNVY